MISYVPKIRVTRPAGPPQVYDLATVTQLTKARPFYEPVVIERELVDRSVDYDPLGYRVTAEIEFVVPNAPTADQTVLEEIMEALMREDDVVEVSLGNDEQGNVLYREVGGFVSAGPEAVENVLQIMRYNWQLIARELVPKAVAPGVGAVPKW